MSYNVSAFPSLKFPEAFHTLIWHYFETTCSGRKHETLNKGQEADTQILFTSFSYLENL